MIHSTKRFVFSLTLCYFVLVLFSLFRIAFTSLGEERANLRAVRTFVRFALVWFGLFPLPLGVLEGLLIAAVPGLFSYLFFHYRDQTWFSCINIHQVPWEVLKTEAKGRGFQHLPRDLANVNALENRVRSLQW